MNQKQMALLWAVGGSIIVLGMVLFSMVTFIKPGYVGVKVNLFGDNKGVDEKEIHVGAHLVPPWKTVYRFPVFEQNHTWEGRECFQFQTSDGMVVHAEIGVTYRIQADSVHKIFCRYRRGVDEITGVFLRNYIRDSLNKAASHYKIEDLYSSKKEAFFDDIQAYVASTLEEIGIDVSRIYLIGRFHFPDAVVSALNKKIEAMQRAEQRENELREAEAEARKVIAAAQGRSESALVEARAGAEAELVRAEAQAKANALLSESLTEPLLLNKAILQWDGQLPRIIGTPAGMLLNMEKIYEQ